MARTERERTLSTLQKCGLVVKSIHKTGYSQDWISSMRTWAHSESIFVYRECLSISYTPHMHSLSLSVVNLGPVASPLLIEVEQIGFILHSALLNTFAKMKSLLSSPRSIACVPSSNSRCATFDFLERTVDYISSNTQTSQQQLLYLTKRLSPP